MLIFSNSCGAERQSPPGVVHHSDRGVQYGARASTSGSCEVFFNRGIHPVLAVDRNEDAKAGVTDVDISFGPFTCTAGANGVGKSNLLDAIVFLSALADGARSAPPTLVEGKPPGLHEP